MSHKAHLQTGIDHGAKDYVEKHWNDPVDLDLIAETMVMTQQSKVLHPNELFWTDKDEFASRIVMVTKRYVSKVPNQYSKNEKAHPQEGLMVKGSLQWDWKRAVRDLGDHLTAPAQGIPISRGGPPMVTPKCKSFTKSLNNYYTTAERPDLPLQDLFYSILYYVYIKDGQGRKRGD